MSLIFVRCVTQILPITVDFCEKCLTCVSGRRGRDFECNEKNTNKAIHRYKESVESYVINTKTSPKTKKKCEHISVND